MANVSQEPDDLMAILQRISDNYVALAASSNTNDGKTYYYNKVLYFSGMRSALEENKLVSDKNSKALMAN